EGLAERESPSVALQLSSAEAEEAIRSGRPLLIAGALEIDPDEIDAELRAVSGALAETGSGESERVARAVASAPIEFRDGLAAALRGDDTAIEAAAFRASLALDPFRTLLQLAVQPALWTASEQCRPLADLA